MIVGIFLRNFKTYQGINYIPITDEDRFCGLVGDNGIGKSSILEALDCYFNGKPWNLNTSAKRSGLQNTKPYIVPVFLLKPSQLESENLNLAEQLNHVTLNTTEEDVAPSNKLHLKSFIRHRNELAKKINLNDYLLLPIGLNHKGLESVSIFNTRLLVKEINTEEQDTDKASLDDNRLSTFQGLRLDIQERIEYIYIPREIDPELFTKLETDEIQVLMGETLTEILNQRVSTKQVK